MMEMIMIMMIVCREGLGAIDLRPPKHYRELEGWDQLSEWSDGMWGEAVSRSTGWQGGGACVEAEQAGWEDQEGADCKGWGYVDTSLSITIIILIISIHDRCWAIKGTRPVEGHGDQAEEDGGRTACSQWGHRACQETMMTMMMMMNIELSIITSRSVTKAPGTWELQSLSQ